jgi:hypothetical protein
VNLSRQWYQLRCLKGWAVLLICLLLSGCIHLAPMPYGSQREEAKALARQLRELNTVARKITLRELQLTQELRVVLDELGKLPADEFHRRFKAFADELVNIQKQRVDLLATFNGRQWQTPMVMAVQQGAIQQLKTDLARNQRWGELTEGVRLRVELGRTEGFPELNLLSHQLDIFLQGKADLDPFQDRIEALQDAFLLKESDLN